jgi:hypothetical protein
MQILGQHDYASFYAVGRENAVVIPAQAGIQKVASGPWTPACAGVTKSLF